MGGITLSDLLLCQNCIISNIKLIKQFERTHKKELQRIAKIIYFRHLCSKIVKLSGDKEYQMFYKLFLNMRYASGLYIANQCIRKR